MKRTLSIHLGRQLFVIEEDAFDRLQQYLKRLEASFKGETGINEIMEDIEMRFAELLITYLGETSKVVQIDDVEKAIASLGEPEEISDEQTNNNQQERTYNYSYQQSRSRKFFRDTENSVLAGVCSGLGAYMNMDPVIVRLIFLLLLFTGIAVPLYIILWVIIPNAKSPSDRLQMQGKPVTVDSLKDEFMKATDRMKDDAMHARDKFMHNQQQIVQQAKHVGKLITKLFGFGLVITAGIWLLVFTLIVTGIVDIIPTTGDEHYTSLHDFLQLVVPAGNTFGLVWFSILLTGYAGPLFLILVGTRALMERNNRFFKLNMIIFPVLTGIGILGGIIGALQTGRDYSEYKYIDHQSLAIDTDVLEIDELPHYIHNHRISQSGGIDFITIRHGNIMEEGVLISYKPSNDTLFHVTQKTKAHGTDSDEAVRRAENVHHILRMEGDKLLIDASYYYPASDQMRDQEVEIVIEVPKGKKLKIKDYQTEGITMEKQGMFYTDEPFIPWE